MISREDLQAAVRFRAVRLGRVKDELAFKIYGFCHNMCDVGDAIILSAPDIY